MDCEEEGVLVSALRKTETKQSDFAENKRAVRASEAERIFHRNVDRHFPRIVSAVIEIASWILIEDIDGRGRNLMMHCQYRKY